MNKLIVKDYRKTATEGQPRAPYTIPTDLHSLLPIPSSNTPGSLLKIHASALASFLPSHLCMVWTEQHCLQKQPHSRSGDSQTTLKAGQEKIRYCTILPGSGVGLTEIQPQLKRFRHVQKAYQYSKIRYQKCWHCFSQSQQLAEVVYLFFCMILFLYC